MIGIEQIKQISITSQSKILILIIDGLGGLPDPKTGRTELETAHTPHLDNLAKNGICGLVDPVSSGITPGSGPGHLAIFGYDPLTFTIGRGVLEALGIGFELSENDVTARGNFCTVDEDGLITDRRAGRITTDKSTEICKLLSQSKFEDVEFFVLPVREHRFALILRGEGLRAELTDTDPQRTGVAPYPAKYTKITAKHTADIVNDFVSKAKQILAHHHPANMILFRGFSKLPHIPPMGEIYKLKPAAIARYPMYKGLARLVGMKVFDINDGIKEQLKVLTDCYSQHDFFFIHIKETDSAGEDGDFKRKAQDIEAVDSMIPELLNLKPEVIVVTGDHSTPAMLKGHSWHPVPLLLYSKWCRTDKVEEFSETACALGGLGRFPAVDIMPLAMANALKLTKFGA